jgi:hypothetical protein
MYIVQAKIFRAKRIICLQQTMACLQGLRYQTRSPTRKRPGKESLALRAGPGGALRTSIILYHGHQCEGVSVYTALPLDIKIAGLVVELGCVEVPPSSVKGGLQGERVNTGKQLQPPRDELLLVLASESPLYPTARLDLSAKERGTQQRKEDDDDQAPTSFCEAIE